MFWAVRSMKVILITKTIPIYIDIIIDFLGPGELLALNYKNAA